MKDKIVAMTGFDKATPVVYAGRKVLLTVVEPLAYGLAIVRVPVKARGTKKIPSRASHQLAHRSGLCVAHSEDIDALKDFAVALCATAAWQIASVETDGVKVQTLFSKHSTPKEREILKALHAECDKVTP